MFDLYDCVDFTDPALETRGWGRTPVHDYTLLTITWSMNITQTCPHLTPGTCSVTSVSSDRRASGRVALWSGAAGEDLPQRDPVHRVLDGTKLWNYKFRQHPVCCAHGVPVHHHGGLGGDPLQRECARCLTWFLQWMFNQFFSDIPKTHTLAKDGPDCH